MGEIRPRSPLMPNHDTCEVWRESAAPERIATAAAALPLPQPNVNAPQPPKTLQPVYAEPGEARVQALRMVWPIVCRRLESLPNINTSQLFDELCAQFLADLPQGNTRRCCWG